MESRFYALIKQFAAFQVFQNYFSFFLRFISLLGRATAKTYCRIWLKERERESVGLPMLPIGRGCPTLSSSLLVNVSGEFELYSNSTQRTPFSLYVVVIVKLNVSKKLRDNSLSA